MNTAELAAHPEYQALHAGVLAAPEDDLPRLVLADWLDEHAGWSDCPTHVTDVEPTFVCKVCNAVERHGRLYHNPGCRVPGMGEKKESNFAEVTCLACHDAGRVGDGLKEYAEFIRVQCELSHFSEDDLQERKPHWIPVCEPKHRRWERAQALRRLERELWNALGREQLAPGLPDIYPMSCRDDFVTYDGRMALFRRGFVSEVRCTLADWCGGECGDCDGTGRDASPTDDDWTCRECSGTGRTPGIGPRLLKLQPVQKVTLIGIDPLPAQNQTHGRGTHGWFRGTNRSGLHPESDLPEPIYDLLEGGRKNLGNCEYDSRDEAVEAANAAALAWAKRWNPKADFTPPRVTA